MNDSESQQQRQAVQLVHRLQLFEDLLILISLPILIVVFILWAVASAFPSVATMINLSISVLLVLVSCVVLIRLAEVAWKWGTNFAVRPVDEGTFYAMGIAMLIFLVASALFALVSTIMHAGASSDERTYLIIGLLVILVLQYREITARYLKKMG